MIKERNKEIKELKYDRDKINEAFKKVNQEFFRAA